jgi:NADPH-dependent ferric siderophore reductase
LAGPRGSLIVADDFDHYLLIGDETALPAIGRGVEGLRPDVPVTTVVVVDDAEEIQTFATRADLRPFWVERSGRDHDDASLLREALDRWAAPPGDGYAWIAAEAQVARALKAHMLEDRGHPKAWLKAAGYWVSGKAGESEKVEN